MVMIPMRNGRPWWVPLGIAIAWVAIAKPILAAFGVRLP